MTLTPEDIDKLDTLSVNTKISSEILRLYVGPRMVNLIAIVMQIEQEPTLLHKVRTIAVVALAAMEAGKQLGKIEIVEKEASQ